MDNQDEYFSTIIERSEKSEYGIEIPRDLSTAELLEWIDNLNLE